jgi:hypothetical protein
MMRSIHDNVLTSYTVNGEARRITLRTEFRDQEPVEHTEVVFTKVVAYHFEGDTLGNILFDIAETPLEQILQDHADLFDRGRSYGWPAVPHESTEELLRVLRERGIRGYVLSASYGMEGFVLAEGMHLDAPVPDEPSTEPGGGA